MFKRFALKVYLLVSALFLFSKLSNSQVSINEIKAWSTIYVHPAGISDWVELKNEGPTPVDVSGYFISDDPENPTRWMIPAGTTIAAGDFLIIWLNGDNDAGNMEASFSLEKDGEYLSLMTSALTLIESVEFPEQYINESYGKLSDGSWGYFSNSTRDAENDFSSGYQIMSTDPEISYGSGLYSSSINVEINSLEDGVIYYTLDGSAPNTSSSVYSGPINISSKSVLKARAYATDKASQIVGSSYVFGASHDLPVIFLTSANDRKEWVDQNIGKEDMDGRIRLEYYEANNGRKAVDQYAIFGESGKTSSNVSKLNGKVYPRNGEFDYNFFPNKKMKSKNGFLLRNASQDNANAHMRNGVLSRIIGKDDVSDGFYFAGFQPAVLYTDGVYEGIIHISEDDDNMFFKNNFPGIDYIYETRRDDAPDADIIGLNSLHYDFSNPTDRAEFESKKNLHDMLISFHFHWYLQPIESPQVVTGTISGRTPSDVHFLYDADNCFGGSYNGSRAFPIFNFTPYMSSVDFWASKTGWGGHPDFPSNILAYGPYKLDAAQFSCAFHNFVINEDRVVGIIDEIANSYIGEMDATADAMLRAISILEPFPRPFSYNNEAEWLLNVDTLKQFARKSNEGIFDWLKTTYGYSEYVDVQIETSGAHQGNVRVHGIKVVGDDQTGQFFKDIPLMVKAVPQPGHQFSHWEGDLSGTNINEEITFSTNGNIRAVFVPITFVADDIMINEVQSINNATVTDEAGEYNDWFEIYNKETFAVDLAGYYVSDDSCDIRKWQIRSTDAAKTTVEGESWLVLWADKDTAQGPNHLDFKLNASEHIILTYPDGVTRVDIVEFDLEADQSFGAEVDGGDIDIVFEEATPPTPGASNSGGGISIEEVNLKMIQTFPNPATESLNITGVDGVFEELEIYSLDGKLQLLKKNFNVQSAINIEGLSPGVYFIHLNNEDGKYVGKFNVK